ncbi:MAG: aldo/keto reductase [Candidatus Kariarchaeaceae archaeon]|jgi:aryl-alcohol dehydrogenase-like predicted oxidoreductase
MKYRNMGKHGLLLSEISLGTMYVGSHHSKEQSKKVLKAAIEQGINFIDCADRYGIYDSELPMDQRTPAEKIVGEFIQDYDRQDLVLSTKVFYQMNEKNPNSGGLNRKHIKEGIANSLENMQTDYVDIYYCHRPDRNDHGRIKTPLEETIRTMTNLIDEGIIHYWGTSWWPPVEIERCHGIAKEQGLIAPSVEQPPYHPNARFIEQDLFNVAEYHGMGLTTFEALASGFYTGKYHQSKEFPEGSRATKFTLVNDEVIEKRRPLIEELRKIAIELDVTIAQVVIAWSIRSPLISSSVMGASKPEQVIENAAASEIRLSEDNLKRIEKFTEPLPRYNYR